MGASPCKDWTLAAAADFEELAVTFGVAGGSGGQLRRARLHEVGPEVDGRVRVLGGLKPGKKIMTEGALFLKHEIESL